MNIIFIIIFIEAVLSADNNILFPEKPRIYMGITEFENTGIGFFGGGKDSDNLIVNTVNIYNSLSNNWNITYLSRSVGELTAASIEKHQIVLFAGGRFSNNTFSNVIDIYNYTTGIWSQSLLTSPKYFINSKSPSLPEQGLAFFIGGFEKQESYSGAMDIYNIFTKTTTKKYIPFSPITCYGDSFPDKAIITIACSNTISTYVMTYNAITDNWIYLKEIENRIDFRVISIKNMDQFIVIGGFNPFTELMLNTVNIINITSNTSKNLFLSEARSDMGVAYLPSKKLLYVAGGLVIMNNGFYFSSAVDIINLQNFDKYVNFLTTGKEELTGIFLNSIGKVIFAGGQPFNNYLDSYSYCPGGYNGPNNGICSLCNQGYYSPFGSMNCFICPSGSYCPDTGTSLPIPSPPGWYIPLQGQTEPFFSTCVYGFFCPSGSASPRPCPPGNFCPNIGLDKPIQCPAGTYNSQSQSTTYTNCIPCPSGTYCNLVIGATDVIPCPSGKYCPESSISFNNSCPIGYYCPLGATNPIECPPGTYCPIGSSVPTLCLSGYYCPKFTEKQIQCPGGYQCPAGANVPEICETGTYALAGTGVCSKCPAHQYNTNPGSQYCSACEPSLLSIFTVWFCMSYTEKLVFIWTWFITIITGSITAFNIYKTTKKKYDSVKDLDGGFLLCNMLCVSLALKKYNHRKGFELTNNEAYRLSKDGQLKSVNIETIHDILLGDKNNQINKINLKISPNGECNRY